MIKRIVISSFCLIISCISSLHAITQNEQALIQAVKNNQEPITIQLLQAGADPNAQENINSLTPLMYAASNNRPVTIGLLVNHGADVNKANTSGWNPLLLAAHHGNTDAIRTLAYHGADLEFEHPYNQLDALTLAASKGHVGTVQALIQVGASIPTAEYIRQTKGLNNHQKERAIQTINRARALLR